MRKKKRFGQNFLRDVNIIGQIVDSISPQADDVFFEIGPGEGALTEHLIRSGARVIAVEIDRDLIPKLQKRFGGFGNQLELINADVLQVDWADIMSLNMSQKHHIRLVGNLPYNISTPLLLRFVECVQYLKDAHIMVQKEVGDRLQATVGHTDYGRLSIAVQSAFDAELQLHVPPNAFSPPPAVQSSVLRLLPLVHPIVHSADFEHVVSIAFQQRRKTIENALSSLIADTDLTDINWDALGIDAKKRPNQLTIEEYQKLTDCFNASKN